MIRFTEWLYEQPNISPSCSREYLCYQDPLEMDRAILEWLELSGYHHADECAVFDLHRQENEILGCPNPWYGSCPTCRIGMVREHRPADGKCERCGTKLIER